MRLTHFSLFTGIGGIDLAAEWAGFETVGQVEKNEFCQKILTRHWPDVPGWEDVDNVTEKSFRERLGDRRIHLLSGGFPCQPFSQAGKRKGTDDDRDLWPEMFRVVQELRPAWVLGENVANYTNMGLDRTIFDLESEGYTVRPFEIPAVAVQAPHQRMRVFIVAHHDRGNGEGINLPEGRKIQGGDHKTVADPDRAGCEEQHVPPQPARSRPSPGRRDEESSSHPEESRRNAKQIEKHGRKKPTGETRGRNLKTNERWCLSESPVCGANDGVPDRVDRLKSLGNAVVPQQVYPILKSIHEIETGD